MGCTGSSDKGQAEEAPLADIGHARGGKRAGGGKRRKKKSDSNNAKMGSSTVGAAKVAAAPTNPLVHAPEAENTVASSSGRSGSVRPARATAASRQVESDELAHRRDVQGAESRQWQMLLHDFADLKPMAESTEGAAVNIDGATIQYNIADNFDDDDDRPRRSTMNQREYGEASKMRSVTATLSRSNTPAVDVPPLSAAGVATHASEEDCWVILRGEVYDVTAILDDHPGGAYAVFQHGGRDATQAFEDAHPAGRRPWQQLEQFKKGKVQPFDDQGRGQSMGLGRFVAKRNVVDV